MVYAGQLAHCTATLEPSLDPDDEKLGPCTNKPKVCRSRPEHSITPGDRVLEIDNVQLPCKVFAITVQPDELLNLIMDVLERQRWYLAAAAS